VTGLTITGGRVLDPGQGLDVAATITVEDGLITGIGEPAAEPPPHGHSGEVIDAAGLILVPGLVDLHTHLYEGVSHYGVDPDTHCLGRGVTTAADAGSAGAQTFPGLRRHIIDPARTQIFAFLNIAVQGMISSLVGELEDLRWGSPWQAAARGREHRDKVVGIKVRLGYQMVGNDPEPAMRMARAAADELGLPVMVHVIDMRPPVTWLLRHLKPGDIVTHSFHGNEGGILGPDGRLVRGLAEARGRGVIFDVGHGAGSFSYRVARAAVAQDFPPATISSDLHAHNVQGPVWDQATTLSKLLHVGMDLPAVIHATTAAPARALGKHDSIGALAPGRTADITALELRTGHWSLPDAAGGTETVGQLLVPRFVVRAGTVHHLPPHPVASHRS
jgi:dihydroorotase